MTRFARIDINDAVEMLRDYPAQPGDLPHKGWRWLPCPEVQRPAFNPITEVVEGPTYTVGESSVTEAWSKRNKTVQEINDEKDDAVGDLNGTLYAALAKVLLKHENRIRALESKAAITMAQFKTGVKGLL